jgi:hypothetical protein
MCGGQLDIEMSFVRQSEVMSCIEQLITQLLTRFAPQCLALASHSHSHSSASASASEQQKPAFVAYPFPHITYRQAMEVYGVDKPDTRYDLRLHDVTSALRALPPAASASASASAPSKLPAMFAAALQHSAPQHPTQSGGEDWGRSVLKVIHIPASALGAGAGTGLQRKEIEQLTAAALSDGLLQGVLFAPVIASPTSGSGSGSALSVKVPKAYAALNEPAVWSALQLALKQSVGRAMPVPPASAPSASPCAVQPTSGEWALGAGDVLVFSAGDNVKVSKGLGMPLCVGCGADVVCCVVLCCVVLACGVM